MSQQILPIELPGGFTFEMVFVEGGTFNMGGSDNEAIDWEKPVHQVVVPSFYIGKLPVTQALWKAAMGEGSNPSHFKGDKQPVESVSWEEVKDFLLCLNKQAGRSFRLPTEAEWEYAARGGKYSQGYRYAGCDKLKQVGWFAENSRAETKEDGKLLANELSLHDMSGNVWEWCQDDWYPNYEDAPVDGSARMEKPERSDLRVFRGGSSFQQFGDCRPSFRFRQDSWFSSHDIGFRLALPFLSAE